MVTVSLMVIFLVAFRVNVVVPDAVFVIELVTVMSPYTPVGPLPVTEPAPVAEAEVVSTVTLVVLRAVPMVDA